MNVHLDGRAALLALSLAACSTPIVGGDIGSDTGMDSGAFDSDGSGPDVDASPPPTDTFEGDAPRSDIPAPRSIAPLSGATVSTRRPGLRWRLAPGSDGAVVEFCATRSCTSVVSSFTATGETGSPSADLPSGVVFWRTRGALRGVAGSNASPVWQVVVPTRSAPVSSSWGSLGDFNGDGLSDLAVGAHGPLDVSRGHVYVYRSVAGMGIPAAPTQDIEGPGREGGDFGLRIAGAGDVNGDGLADLLVGAQYAVSPTVGRTYVYLGSPGPFALSPIALESRGYGNTGIGDVNGDGYSDIAAGSFATATMDIYLGGPSGPPIRPSVSLAGPPSAATGLYGYYVSGGDVNADGFADLFISSFDEPLGGRVYAYYGSETGLPATPSQTLTAPADGGRFGYAAHVGDVNGDGYGDLAVGNGGVGAVYLYFGSASGIPALASVTILAPSDGGTTGFGHTVAYGGDTNGDGYSDILVGNYDFPSGPPDRRGRGYLLYGGSTGPAATPSVSFFSPDGADGWFGISAAGGDVDGDGFSDIVIGSHLATFTGRVHGFAGGAAGVSTTRRWLVESPGGSDTRFGGTLSL